MEKDLFPSTGTQRDRRWS